MLKKFQLHFPQRLDLLHTSLTLYQNEIVCCSLNVTVVSLCFLSFPSISVELAIIMELQ